MTKKKIMQIFLTILLTLSATNVAYSQNLREIIDSAKNFLETESVKAFEVKRKSPKGKTIKKTRLEIHLAVYCGNELNKVKIEIDQDGQNLSVLTENFTVELLRWYDGEISKLKNHNPYWNFFNSHYGISKQRKPCVVVGNRYPIDNKNSPFNFKKTGGIFYAPHSRLLHNTYGKNLEKEGEKYLLETIEKAFQDLESKDIKPLSRRRSFRDIVTPEYLGWIIAIEHMSDQTFFDSPNYAFQRSREIIGINREKSFNYTVSHAKASGIAQFMKSTYSFLVKKYPRADLKKNFLEGASNHLNAVKAMVLLMDYNLYEIEKRKGYIPSKKDTLLAIAYNAGLGRVDKYLAQANPKKKQKNPLRFETEIYLKKLAFVKDYTSLKLTPTASL